MNIFLYVNEMKFYMYCNIVCFIIKEIIVNYMNICVILFMLYDLYWLNILMKCN